MAQVSSVHIEHDTFDWHALVMLVPPPDPSSPYPEPFRSPNTLAGPFPHAQAFETPVLMLHHATRSLAMTLICSALARMAWHSLNQFLDLQGRVSRFEGGCTRPRSFSWRGTSREEL